MFTSIINIRRNNVQKSLLPLSKAIWTHLSLKHIVKMLVIVLLAILPFSLGDRCQHPPPAPNYQNSLYQGRWYEIGKVINQTNFFSTQFQNHFGESNFSFYCQVFHIVILNDEWSKSMRKPAGYVIIYDESTTYKEKIVAEPRICAKSQKTRFVIFRILLQLSFFFPFEKTDFILRNSISHPSSCVWKARSKIYALNHYYFQIQTPGGASFQEGTVCTIATYNPDEAEVGGGAIGYSSRKETTTGDYVNATGTPKENATCSLTKKVNGWYIKAFSVDLEWFSSRLFDGFFQTLCNMQKCKRNKEHES